MILGRDYKLTLTYQLTKENDSLSLLASFAGSLSYKVDTLFIIGDEDYDASQTYLKCREVLGNISWNFKYQNTKSKYPAGLDPACSSVDHGHLGREEDSALHFDVNALSSHIC